ncbi:hypothetical protein MRB53_027103 [Persea americana]|uniref:Uncharacterized protein n=1 Tax=Persea americana TaxID=3435 RepID=A0ACC2LKY3_PERAE|nr:hypothetical protein MRB53_027103 [Persea americana]
MAKEMRRKGCISSDDDIEKRRECNRKGLKLFGVRILGQGEKEGEEGMRKSYSMGNFGTCMDLEQTTGEQGYLSDGHLQSKSSRRGRRNMRKKGVPWTKEEHETFLAGLKRLGKGDWKGISRNFVRTRTPTQVASHAQKYFLRQTTPSEKKRRPSLFDAVINDNVETSKTAPTFCMMARTIQISGETSAGNKTQAAARSLEATPILSSTTCGQASNFHGFSDKEEISKDITDQPFFRCSEVLRTNSLIPTIRSCSRTHLIPPKIYNDYVPRVHGLLQQSFSPLPQSNPPAVPRMTDTNNLELTISPPRPLKAI